MSYLPGHPRIPPRFVTFALTDRDDGSEWAILIETSGEYIKLVSPVPAGFDGDVYGPREGPYIDTHFGSVKLFMRDGALGYEHPVPNVNSRPILAPNKVRANVNNTFYQILFPATQDDTTGALAYETEV